MKKKDPTSHRIIEKRRRDRMNNCLADLSKLIPSHYLRKGRGRVEKTEIIEMAIKHLKDLIEATPSVSFPVQAEPHSAQQQFSTERRLARAETEPMDFSVAGAQLGDTCPATSLAGSCSVQAVEARRHHHQRLPSPLAPRPSLAVYSCLSSSLSTDEHRQNENNAHQMNAGAPGRDGQVPSAARNRIVCCSCRARAASRIADRANGSGSDSGSGSHSHNGSLSDQSDAGSTDNSNSPQAVNKWAAREAGQTKSSPNTCSSSSSSSSNSSHNSSSSRSSSSSGWYKKAWLVRSFSREPPEVG